MKSVSISGSLRENVGNKDAKAQRAKNLVPCVVYGGAEQYHIVVEEKQFKNLIYTPEARYAELTFGDKKINAIIQESQFHPTTERLLHVDFLEVSDNKPITIAVPIKPLGTSPGVLIGGKMISKFRKLRLKGLLKDMPEFVGVDISKLELEQSVKIGDLSVPNITIIELKQNVVILVSRTRNIVAEV
ncbi:MAG: 50S ribosomal protein L25 [Bacteroidota bacterium]